MSNEYKKHVPVPGVPGTRLAMAHTQVTFALLKALLNWPAQGSRPVELFHRDVGWSITQGILDSSVLVFTDVEPEFVAGLPLFVFHRPAAFHLGYNRLLVPLARMMVCQGSPSSSAIEDTDTGVGDGTALCGRFPRPLYSGTTHSGWLRHTNWLAWMCKEYADLLKTAREEATAEMIREAKTLGANAVIGIRFGTSNVTTGAAEIIAYGTAVKI